MEKVSASSTFGNYRWSAECEVSNEQAEMLANAGFLWVMQRSPSSAAEKAMGGYEKRPDGYKRSSIKFDDKGVKLLTENLGKPVVIGEDDDGNDIKITPKVTKVVFHEIGAGAEPKYAEEKEIVIRHTKAGDLAEWAKDKIGFTGTNLNVENVEFLKAVKAYKQSLLKAV